MKKLKDILTYIGNYQLIGDASIDISGITLDSRQVKKAYLFVAVKGHSLDGHNFIDTAINNGATAIFCNELPSNLKEGITYVQVNYLLTNSGMLAKAFYDNPSENLVLIGVTGTNGKTTVATLLFELFNNLGYKCGLISTVRNIIGNEVIPSTHTTPDPFSLNQLIKKMAESGVSYCFMECSSHAIDQERIAGLDFTGAIFTNITHDHLDYHGTFDNYLKAKKKFFDDLNPSAWALTNKDDRNGSVMLQNTQATRYYYALTQPADFKTRIIEHDFNGLLLDINGDQAWFSLVGKFNAYNLLAVYSAAFLSGIKHEEIILALSKVKPVKGRFEYFKSKHGVIGIVDYAHTPDALENILVTINEVRTKNENLICVVGCGGDRDKTKRPIMAAIAAEKSSKVIFTSDNPRTENPETILDEMQAGVPGIFYKKTLRISDRKEAIKTAVMMAQKGDIILVAGKGHENYQEINGVKHHFDDKELLIEFLNEIN